MNVIGLKEDYLQDLNYFLEYADSPRGKENDEQYPQESFHLDFYLNHSKEELYDYINQFLTHNNVNNDYDFYYLMKCIIKYMSGFSDSHTMVRKNDNTWFPIRFKVVNNNVYIDRCFDEKKLKKIIKKINGVDINVIINEISNCTSYGTNGWLLSNIEGKLCSKNDILSLPCMNSKDSKIVYELENDEKISFDINEKCELETIHPKKEIEQYNVIDDMLVFKYPSCKENYKPDINKIEEIIIGSDIKKFILDLRSNSGGNSNIIRPLIEYLSNKDLELFTLVDRGVFSSGRFAVIDMKRIGSKIVGEEIGTPINCFGYVSGNGVTPNSNIYFNFARVYWYEDNGFMKGIYTKQDLRKKDNNFFEPKYLTIDIPIEINEEEYINSLEDVFFNRCIASIRTNSLKK